MIWRALVAISGLAVVAAATHGNVRHTGGYVTTESWLAIAVSALLAVGMGYVAKEWRHGSKLGATLLTVCLLAGETYWLLQNTERELQVRADAERPFQEAHDKRAKAQKRIDEAKEGKRKADDAALTQAALPGCKANCAKLLTDAREAARIELDNARASLAALPKDGSSVSLADNLGVSRWAWDLFVAGLRGLPIIGGSIAVGLALHPRRKAEVQVTSARQMSPRSKRSRRSKLHHRSAHLVAARFTRRRSRSRPAPSTNESKCRISSGLPFAQILLRRRHCGGSMRAILFGAESSQSIPCHRYSSASSSAP
jgi:hypothetical protein